MQTPMQELVERLLKLSNHTYFNGKKSDCDIIDKIQSIIKTEYVEKEKRAIIDAYNNIKPDYLDGNKIDGEEFFKEVYDGKI